MPELDPLRARVALEGVDKAVRDLRSFSVGALDAEKALRGAGLAVGAFSAAALASAIREAISFESAMAGVAKTVDASEEAIAALGDEFQALSERIPVSTNELARLGQVAGQLGVRTENISSFVEVTAKLGAAVDDLSPEAAATELARLAQVTGTSQDEFENLASSLVDLGNNFATTEGQILELAQRLAGAGRQIGLTEGEILGFSAALRSVGVDAEAGGTALSRIFLGIQDAVLTGGEALRAFAQTAGQSVEEFRTAFQQDAAAAVTEFIRGIRAISEAGGSITPVLEAIGLNNVRVRDALLRSALASDTLTEALRHGNDAYRENTALSREAARRFGTTESQLKILRNTITNTAADIGADLLPTVRSLAEGVAALADVFGELDPAVRTTTLGLGVLAGLLAVGGPVLAGIGALTILIGKAAQAADDELSPAAERLRDWLEELEIQSLETAQAISTALTGQLANTLIEIDKLQRELEELSGLERLAIAGLTTPGTQTLATGLLAGRQKDLDQLKSLREQADLLRGKIGEIGEAAEKGFEKVEEGAKKGKRETDRAKKSLEELNAELRAIGEIDVKPPDLTSPLLREVEALRTSIATAFPDIARRAETIKGLDDLTLRRFRAAIEDVIRKGGKAGEVMLALQGVFQEFGLTIEDLPDFLQDAVRGMTDVGGETDTAGQKLDEFLDRAADMAQVADFVLDTAKAFGILGDEASDASRAIEGAIRGAAIGSQFGPVGAAVGGGLGLIGGLVGGGGPTPAEQERLRELKANTEAIRQLTRDVDRLRGVVFDIPGDLIAAARDAVSDFPDITGGLAAASGQINQFIETLTDAEIEDLIEFANRYGIEVDALNDLYQDGAVDVFRLRDEFETLQKAIDAIDLDRLLNTFEGQMSLLQREFDLFDIDNPIDQLQRLKETALGLDELPDTIKAQLRQIDVSTPEGRAELERFVQRLFREFQTNPAFLEALGLSADQFLDFIGEMERLADAAEETAGSAGDSASEGFRSVRTITEQGANLMIAVLTTIAITLDQIKTIEAAQLVALGGNVPEGTGGQLPPGFGGSVDPAVFMRMDSHLGRIDENLETFLGLAQQALIPGSASASPSAGPAAGMIEFTVNVHGIGSRTATIDLDRVDGGLGTRRIDMDFYTGRQRTV